jgi:hypothetical protein
MQERVWNIPEFYSAEFFSKGLISFVSLTSLEGAVFVLFFTPGKGEIMQQHKGNPFHKGTVS